MSAFNATSVHNDEEEDFLPPGFLPSKTESLSFLDSLEADLQAEVNEGRAFLRQTIPKSASSDDLVANSVVLRTVLGDKSKNCSRGNTGGHLKKQQADEIKKLKAEKEKLLRDHQELELELSLERNENHTLVESLRREKEILSSQLTQEKSKSNETLRTIESEMQTARAENERTIQVLRTKVQHLETDQKKLLGDFEVQRRLNDDTLKRKLEELKCEIEASHESDIHKLLDELQSIRKAKDEACEEVLKYKGLLNDKRSDLSATIRSLQRRMGAFRDESDQFKKLYADERNKFKLVYQELIDCKSEREELFGKCQSLEQETTLLSRKIRQVETSLTEKDQLIARLEEAVRNDTATNGKSSENQLAEEMEFLQATLDDEIRRNSIEVGRLKAEIKLVSNALENELSKTRTLKDALEEEQFYTTELENVIAEWEGDTNCLHGTNEENSLLKQQLSEATSRIQALSTELERANINVRETIQRENVLKHLVKKLKDSRLASDSRLRHHQDESSRIAREAMDYVNSAYKQRLDGQSAIIEKQQEREESLNSENMALKQGLHETLANLSHVSKLKVKTEEAFENAMYGANKMVQDLQSKHELSLAQHQEQYELMEEDLLEVLEHEEEMKEEYHAAIVREQCKLAEMVDEHKRSLEELHKVRAEVRSLKELMVDTPYCIMDLVDVFRWCKQHFKEDSLTSIPTSSVPYPGTTTKSSCEKSHDFLVDPAETKANSHQSQENSTCEALGSDTKPNLVEGAKITGTSETTNNIKQMSLSKTIPRQQSSLLDTNQVEESLGLTPLPRPSQDPSSGLVLRVTKPKLAQDERSTTVAATTNKVIPMRTSLSAPSKQSKLWDPNTEVNSGSVRKKAVGDLENSDETYAGQSRDTTSSCGEKTTGTCPSETTKDSKRMRSSLTAPNQHSKLLKIRQSNLAAPSKGKCGKVSSALRSKTAQAMENTGVNSITSCASGKKPNKALSQKRFSLCGVPRPSTSMPKHKSRLSTLSTISRNSFKGMKSSSENDLLTPKKEDLSRQLDDLSALSAMKLNSTGSKVPRSTVSRKSTTQHHRQAITGVKPAPYASRIPQATPLRVKGQVVELLSPESPLLTPAKKRRREEPKINVVPVQSAWRRYAHTKKYRGKQQAIRKLQSFFRSCIVRSQLRSMQLLDRRVEIPQKESPFKNAVLIQKNLRMASEKAKFRRILRSILTVQRFYRRRLRKRELKRENAVIIQTFVRSRLALCRLKSSKHAATLIQATVRQLLARSAFVTKRSSCVSLQASWRRYVHAMQFVHQRKAALTIRSFLHFCRLRRNATIVIQRCARGYLSRKVHSLREKNVKSAILIQACWRRNDHQTMFLSMKSACVTIQASWRRYVHVKRFVRQRNAAFSIRSFLKLCVARTKANTTIQLCVRRFLARKDLCDVKIKFQSAILIQSCWRRKIHQTMFRTMKSACVTAQASWRRYVHVKQFVRQRNAAFSIRSFLKLCVARTKASIIIQLCTRQYLARKTHLVLKRQVVSVIMIQACWRRRRCQTIQLHRFEAAIRLQSFFRQCHCRSRFVSSREKVSRLQMAYRRHRSLKLKRHEAATIIQMVYSGYLSRKRRVVACCLIQGIFRGKAVRERGKKQVGSALMIQSTYRMTKERKQLTRLRQACITIQRAQVQRTQRIQQEHSAATSIQSLWRKWILLKQFQSFRTSSLVLQSWLRGVFVRRHLFSQRLAVARIEKWWIAMQTKRKMYVAATTIQAMLRMRTCRRNFSACLSATITLQAMARKLSKLQHIENYLDSIRNANVARDCAATVLQACVRRRRQQCQFQKMRSSCETIQAGWRRRRNKKLRLDHPKKLELPQPLETVDVGSGRTRRSKRLRAEAKASNEKHHLRSSSTAINANASKLETSDTSDTDVNTRRNEFMKFKVTELRRKLQQLGVESRQYNKLRKAELVEMMLKLT